MNSLISLSKEEFLDLAKTARRVIVFQEIWADRLTPMSIFEILSEEMTHGAILESGMQIPGMSHYSFLAFDPIAELRATQQNINQKIGTQTSSFEENPIVALRKLISDLDCSISERIPYFIGGGIGFISYDAVRLFENIPDRHSNADNLPDILINFYRTTLRFDHQQEKLLVSMIAEINGNPEQAYQETQEKISALIKKINHTPFHSVEVKSKPKHSDASIKVDVSDKDFIQLVERAKQYIVKGDAFQIVLSRCFNKNYSVKPFEIYRALRKVSPAPYMFYVPFDDSVIVGASPERMVTVNEREVIVNPIAGTRRRTEHTHDDDLAKELLNDEKELAEHMMLVDLARNDVGAVSEPGSVKVTELLAVKHYSHVSHLTSVVTGRLRKNLDAFDALAAAFPAGTLSGAPKIRAMEIIDELEQSRRGVYGGAICRLDYHGNLDSCIAIRMAVLKDGNAIVRAGAGVVYDSNPLSEAQETLNKARAMLEAIILAHEE